MTIPKNGKHKEYALYAEHCLAMAEIATDQNLASFNAKWRPNGSSWQMLFPSTVSVAMQCEPCMNNCSLVADDPSTSIGPLLLFAGRNG